MSTTVESLELEIVSNSKSAGDGIDALTRSLEKLRKATNGGAGLSSVSKEMSKTATIAKQLKDTNAKVSGSFTDLYHKVSLGTRAVAAFGKTLWSAIDKSNDYIENVNLFSVAMGEYASEAMTYAESVSDAMGIDTSDWIRSQGVFMTLATGFGVAGDRAKVMSQNLTQLGYDLASFYNLDVEDAMQKLQSGLSGELEPLRRVGYDLSQAKLEATALELGITKSVSAMTQAEKAQLRYYAIMTQVTTAQGDMARTLDDPANQVRVLKAELNMAAREIGNVFIPALTAILPYAIAVVKVVKILAENIASLFGYEPPELGEGTNSMVENTDAVTENLQESQEEAKKLKSYMLGFDELNVINPNTEDSEDTSDMFDFELPEYDFMNGLVESKVNTIVEEMKEWLGITGEIDSWSELFDTRLGTILESAIAIGGAIAAWKIATDTIDAVTTITQLLANPAIAITLGATLAITGITLSFIGMDDAIKNGLDGFNFAEIVGSALVGTGGAALLGSSIAIWLDTAFASSPVTLALTQAGINLGVGTMGAAGAALASAITAIIVGIPMYFVGIYDACVEGLDWLNSLLITLGATLAGAGIGVLVGAIAGTVGGPMGAAIGALIGLAVGLITDLVILIVQNWDSICSWLGKVGEWIYTNVIVPVGNFFKGLWETVAGFMSDLWDDIVVIWKVVATWFDETVIQPIVTFFEGALLRIGQFFEGCWIIIQAVWLIASTWMNENVIQPTVNFFKGLWETVSKYFEDLWSDIKKIWESVSKWFNETVVIPVVNFFKGVWTSVSGFFTSLWEDVVEVWNKVATWFNDTIIDPVKTAFEEACKAIQEFFSSLWLKIRQGVANAMNGVIGGIESAINWVVRGINKLISGFNDVVQWAADIIGAEWGGVTLVQEVSFQRIPVPTFAEGGFPEEGQMFIAREAGAEMVGNIGRRTAVANNDQIVSGIAGGVAEANAEQNMLLREQNSLLRAILEKDNGVYLDGKPLTNSVEKYQRERGRVLITGGVL